MSIFKLNHIPPCPKGIEIYADCHFAGLEASDKVAEGKTEIYVRYDCAFGSWLQKNGMASAHGLYSIISVPNEAYAVAFTDELLKRHNTASFYKHEKGES